MGLPVGPCVLLMLGVWLGTMVSKTTSVASVVSSGCTRTTVNSGSASPGSIVASACVLLSAWLGLGVSLASAVTVAVGSVAVAVGLGVLLSVQVGLGSKGVSLGTAPERAAVLKIQWKYRAKVTPEKKFA